MDRQEVYEILRKDFCKVFNCGSLRRACAYTVGQLDGKKEAIAILLDMAQDQTMDGHVRRYCAEAVGELGRKGKAVTILLSMVQDQKQGNSLRRACVIVLGGYSWVTKRRASTYY